MSGFFKSVTQKSQLRIHFYDSQGTHWLLVYQDVIKWGMPHLVLDADNHIEHLSVPQLGSPSMLLAVVIRLTMSG